MIAGSMASFAERGNVHKTADTDQLGTSAIVAFIVLLICAVPASAHGAALKDSYVERESVQGLPLEVVGSTVGAGNEAGEPVPKPVSPGGHTVWLEWEAESTGFVTVSTCGSEVPTVVGVYQGSNLQNLTELGAVANFGLECTPITHGVTFHAIAGLKYEILVDGNVFFVPPSPPLSGEGAISLRIEATPPPANDAFADALELTGRFTEEPDGARSYFGETFGYNWGATSETAEPLRQTGSEPPSVWYRWTAPESGPARVAVGGAFGRQIWLGVYSGNSLGSLQPLGAGADFVEFPANTGATYRIVVDGASGEGADAMSSFGIRVSMRLPPSPRPVPAAPTVPIDSLAPETTLRKRQVGLKARAASFAFVSSEAGATFRCKLDRHREVACSSPKAYRRLGYGKHTFKVRAVDAAGNADRTPATFRFSIPRFVGHDSRAFSSNPPR
jgi:hypothetical protein